METIPSRIENAGKVALVVGFDGACPQEGKNVDVRSDGSFVVYPSRRTPEGEGADGRGRSPRFTFRLENPSDQARAVTVAIDHEDEEGNTLPYRDVCFIRHEDDPWRMEPCPVLDGKSILRLTPPLITSASPRNSLRTKKIRAGCPIRPAVPTPTRRWGETPHDAFVHTYGHRGQPSAKGRR